MKKVFTSQNLSLALALVIAVALIVNTVKAIDTNYDLQLEVGKLEEEVALLELQNTNLELQRQYYDSDAFIEYEARRRLNKYAIGESKLILPKYDFPPVEASQTNKATAENQSNLDAWWDFFFN